MIATTNVSLAFGAQRVLDNVSLTLDTKSRAGLVGANGSGKTTLLRILAGREAPESGEVSVSRDLVVSYLPQRFELSLDATVYEAAEGGFRREFQIQKRRDEVAGLLQSGGGANHDALLAELAQLDHDLEESRFYLREPEIAKVLKGLGFEQGDHNRALSEFSGGWRMRAALARTLLSHPHFLLLDEPTNYLDMEARLWLSGFLKGFPGGVLIVSHDRAFLDDTVTEILELFLSRVRRYKGGYSSYEEQRNAELAQLVASWESQQRDIAKQEDFIRRFRAKATKAKQVQSRVKMLEKQERIEIPEHLRPINLKLPPATHSGNIVIEVEELSKSYDADGTTPVLECLTFTVQRGSKLAVLGRNGAGKSTLLRILGGRDEASAGTLSFGRNVEVAYFGQDTPDTLPGELTIIEYASSRASTEAQPMVRDVLGAFLFGGDAVEKRLEVLSGGERSRLAMATLLLRPANLLILDEPTNHLDMTSQEVLAGALRGYSGTVVFVSHDRFFIREVATEVLALWPREQRPPKPGRPAGGAADGVPSQGWQRYPGSYREFEKSGIGRVFEDPTARQSPNRGAGPRPGTAFEPGVHQPKAGPGSPDTETVPGTAGNFQAQKARKAELRKLQKREEELLSRIEALEEEHRRIQESMASPEVYRDPEGLKRNQRALAENEAAQETAHDEWEAVTHAIEGFSG